MAQSKAAPPDVSALEVAGAPSEALSTAIFATALPVAAFVEVAFLGVSPSKISTLLLLGTSVALSGAYVFGRIESMSREMREATSSAMRLPEIGNKIRGRKRGSLVSESRPGRDLALALTTAAFRIEARIDCLESRTARDIETGLLNRDGLMAEIAMEINRARRTDQPMTLGLIDIDNFDRYVGERGSIAAGAAVNAAARIIGARLRNYDRIARRDASCFLLLMPGASAETAMEVLRRVRDDIESELDLPDGVSAGMALLDRSDTGPEPILDRADLRLKQLRLSGGARTVEAA